MSWSWERPVMGTVSQPPRTAATSAKRQGSEEQVTPRIRESYQKSRARGAGQRRESPIAVVPNRRLSLHDGAGTGESDPQLDPHRGDPGGIGSRSARAVEVGQAEPADALDDRLSPAAGVAPQDGLAGTQEKRDALARRVHDAVAVEVALECHERGRGDDDRLDPRARRVIARLPQLLRHAFEGHARRLLRLEPRGAPAVRLEAGMQDAEDTGQHETEDGDRDQELGQREAARRTPRAHGAQLGYAAKRGNFQSSRRSGRGTRISPGWAAAGRPSNRRSRGRSSGRARPPRELEKRVVRAVLLLLGEVVG